MRGVENATKALEGTKVNPSAMSGLNQKMNEKIEA